MHDAPATGRNRAPVSRRDSGGTELEWSREDPLGYALMLDKEHLDEDRRTRGKLVALRASKLFAGLDSELLPPIAALSRFRPFEEGASIWMAGDIADAMIIVNQGFVAALSRSPSGRASISNVFGPTDSAADGLIFNPGGVYPVEAKALTNVQVLWLPLAPLHELCVAHLALRACVERSLREHLLALRDRIGTLSAGPVETRLATFFMFLDSRFGAPENEGRAVRVPLSRAVLADLVAARVETIVRVLSEWKHRKTLVDLEDGFWFAQGALARLISVDSSNE